MDALLAQLSQLETQVRSRSKLPSIVAQLSSTNEAQTSTIARLSSENEALKRQVQDQDRNLVELSDALYPGSRWSWKGEKEEGGKGGIWSWTSARYQSISPSTISSEPPSSLDSLPIELLKIISKLLEEEDKLSLCGVSFRFLEVVAPEIYNKAIILPACDALSFLLPRISTESSRSQRITDLLTPYTLSLGDEDSASTPFVELNEFLVSPPLPSQRVSLYGVMIIITENLNAMMDFWTPFLRFLNPKVVMLGANVGEPSSLTKPPLIIHVHASSPFDFPISEWNRLESVLWVSHVFLLEGSARSAMGETFRDPQYTLVSVPEVGEAVKRELEESEMAAVGLISGEEGGPLKIVVLRIEERMEEEDEGKKEADGSVVDATG